MTSKDKINCYGMAVMLNKKYKFLTPSDTQELYVYKEGIYVKGKIFAERIIETLLKNQASEYYVREILGHLRRMTLKDRDEIKETSTNLICLENGILNIETKKFKEHTPKLVFFNKSLVKYEPSVDCPKIKKFFSEIVNEKDIRVLQEFIGYCLQRDQAYEVALMLYGEGGNGKTQFIKLVKEFIGENNCAGMTIQQIEEDRFMVSRLYGKLINLAADIPPTSLKTTSNFKAIISGDYITGQHKFGHPFDFSPYSKMIFSCNQMPEIKDMSRAFFERWIIIDFPNNFRNSKNKVVNLYKKLSTKKELSGLLNWALEGLSSVRRNNGFGEVNAEITRKIWMKYSDNISSFRENCLVSDINNYEGKQKIYSRYVEFCISNNSIPKTENAFHRSLKTKIPVVDYQPTEEGKQIHAWKGIKLK